MTCLLGLKSQWIIVAGGGSSNSDLQPRLYLEPARPIVTPLITRLQLTTGIYWWRYQVSSGQTPPFWALSRGKQQGTLAQSHSNILSLTLSMSTTLVSLTQRGQRVTWSEWSVSCLLAVNTRRESQSDWQFFQRSNDETFPFIFWVVGVIFKKYWNRGK